MNQGMAILNTDMLLDDLVGIGIQHADHSNGLYSFHQTLINGKRTNSGRNVAAVSLLIHIGDLNIDLTEGIVHVNIRAVGLGDDGHLTGGGDSTAHAVDLLDIGSTHNFQENLVPLGLIFGQILLVENNCLTGASAHIYAGVFFHIHTGLPPIALVFF